MVVGSNPTEKTRLSNTGPTVHPTNPNPSHPYHSPPTRHTSPHPTQPIGLSLL
ncbi:hypothetical protein BV25DRAFT_1086291 [Artomyces pyxidatus]|uniref:Uncharacterized protein n=1 Tax=Artomyces pyxidatus TaxID=48021 RepID=A0ACB8TFS2_9AGAM|nr:hypothetical protein BV25DRAFT_1086291 [Artomyces pyxidatus]